MNGEKPFYLDFERPIVELEKRIEEMEIQAETEGLDLSRELRSLERKVGKLRQETYTNLTRWQRVQMSRHPQRPYTLDYIKNMLEDFVVDFEGGVVGLGFGGLLAQHAKAHVVVRGLDLDGDAALKARTNARVERFQFPWRAVGGDHHLAG